MGLEEFHSRLLAFCGDTPTPVQIARIDLACLLRVQIDGVVRNNGSVNELVKYTNACGRLLREIDGAKPRGIKRVASELRPLFPNNRVVPSPTTPRFVSKRKVTA